MCSPMSHHLHPTPCKKGGAYGILQHQMCMQPSGLLLHNTLNVLQLSLITLQLSPSPTLSCHTFPSTVTLPSRSHFLNCHTPIPSILTLPFLNCHTPISSTVTLPFPQTSHSHSLNSPLAYSTDYRHTPIIGTPLYLLSAGLRTPKYTEIHGKATTCTLPGSCQAALLLPLP